MVARSAKLEGWVAFIDAYGFKHHVLANSLAHTAATMNAIHEWIEAEKYDDLAIYLFSDAIFLFSATSNESPRFEALSKLNSFIKKLQESALRKKIVFRGSVAFGKVALAERICIGQPIIEAYALEQNLAIPGVYLPKRVIKSLHDKQLDAKVRDWDQQLHDIPTKGGGLIAGYFLPPSPVDALKSHVAEMAIRTREDGPDDVAATWKRYHEFLCLVQEREQGDA